MYTFFQNNVILRTPDDNVKSMEGGVVTLFDMSNKELIFLDKESVFNFSKFVGSSEGSFKIEFFKHY
jgi:hypothetical protein